MDRWLGAKTGTVYTFVGIKLGLPSLSQAFIPQGSTSILHILHILRPLCVFYYYRSVNCGNERKYIPVILLVLCVDMQKGPH